MTKLVVLFNFIYFPFVLTSRPKHSYAAMRGKYAIVVLSFNDVLMARANKKHSNSYAVPLYYVLNI